jgi:hypothetical protein
VQHPGSQGLHLKQTEQGLRPRGDRHPQGQTHQKGKGVRPTLEVGEVHPDGAVEQGRYLQQNVHPKCELGPPQREQPSEAEGAEDEEA